MIKIQIYIFLIISFITAQGQYFTPSSSLVFSANQITEEKIASLVSTQRKLFTTLDIEKLRVEIKRSNNAMESRIAQLKGDMTELFNGKQELLKLKDINKLREHILEKEKNRNEIQTEIQNDLSNIQYQGLYLVVIDSIDAFMSKENLSEISEAVLAKQAITELNGIFIESYTITKNNVLIEDRIKSTISGEMSIEKQFISKTFESRTRFLCLVKVNVSPLKKPLQNDGRRRFDGYKYKIINMMKEQDLLAKLSEINLPNDEKDALMSETESAKNIIAETNDIARKRQNEILNNGNANLTRVDAEIEKLKTDMQNRSVLLQKVIEQKTGLVYDPKNIEGGIQKALLFFNNKLAELKKELLLTKQKELVERFSVEVTAEGTPAEDIAKTAIGLIGQMCQSYSKVEKFLESYDVENFMLVSEETVSKKDVYRALDTVWLYPVAGDRDNFIITVVVRFKILENPQKDNKVPTYSSNSVPKVRESNQLPVGVTVQTVSAPQSLEVVEIAPDCRNRVFMESIDYNNKLTFTPTKETIDEINKDVRQPLEFIIKDEIDDDIEIKVLTKQQISQLPSNCHSGILRIVVDSYEAIPDGDDEFDSKVTATCYGYATAQSNEELFKITITSKSDDSNSGLQEPLHQAFETYEDDLEAAVKRSHAIMQKIKYLDPEK